MPRAGFGFLNPANYQEDTGGGFREGLVRIDESHFVVHQKNARKPKDNETAEEKKKREEEAAKNVPHPALRWKGTRLDPDTQEPITDHEGVEEKVEIVLGMGSKALDKIHPGGAESVDSEEVEDLGDAVGTEGNTIYVLDEEFVRKGLHPKTGCAVMFESLKLAGFKMDVVDRVWAPDYVGAVFEIGVHQEETDEVDPKTGKKRTIPYKIVKKIVRAPYETKGKQGAKNTAPKGKESKTSTTAATTTSAAYTGAGAGSGAVNEDAVNALTPILLAMSEKFDGKRMSLKALATEVNAAASKSGVGAKLMVPMIGLVKNVAWLNENGATFDLKVVDGEAQFGDL